MEPAVQSVASSEGQSQFCKAPGHPQNPRGALTRDIPMLATIIDIYPCQGVATDSDLVLSSSSGRDLSMGPDGGAGYSQQATPPHPRVSSSIFRLPKLLHFFFSPICPPQIHIYWWLQRHAGHVARGPWVTSSILTVWYVGKQMSMVCLCHAQERRSGHGMEASRSLTVFLLLCCAAWI